MEEDEVNLAYFLERSMHGYDISRVSDKTGKIISNKKKNLPTMTITMTDDEFEEKNTAKNRKVSQFCNGFVSNVVTGMILPFGNIWYPCKILL